MRPDMVKNNKRFASDAMLRYRAPNVLALRRVGAWSSHSPSKSRYDSMSLQNN